MIVFAVKVSFEMLEDQPRDQANCQRSLHNDQDAGEPLPPPSAFQTVVRGLPCILVIEEAVT